MKNEIISLLASVARTATPTAFVEKANQHEGCVLVIDVTAIAATPSVVVTISGVDALSGKKWTILASAAITGVSTTIMKVGRALTAAANAAANDMLPPHFTVEFVHGDADSITYTAAMHLIGTR